MVRTSKKLTVEQKTLIAFALIFLLGLTLRLYHLGAISFWYDEVGVAMAAMENTLSGAIQIAREHAAAMPLDYVVAWFSNHILGNSEWALRLPAALWSSMALFPIYFLLREFTNRSIALLTCLFTAISPFAVMFAQELRFYSALLFFYYLATWLMMRAIKNPTRVNLLLFGLFTSIGIYFHIYVSLAICNGLIYWLMNRKQVKTSISRILITTIAIDLIALPGYLYFCHGESIYEFGVNYPLVPFLILQGVGLLPSYSGFNLTEWVYYVLLILIVLLGGYTILKKRNKNIIALIISISLQVALIIAADAFTGYFFAARQVLFLLPVPSLITAMTVDEIRKPQKTNQIISAVITLTLVISSFPANATNFRLKKSISRELSAALVQDFSPNTSVLVIPRWNALSFDYYLNHRFNRPDIAKAVHGTDVEELVAMDALTNPTWLIIKANYLSVHPDWLKENHFTQVDIEDNLSYSAELLFIRDEE